MKRSSNLPVKKRLTRGTSRIVGQNITAAAPGDTEGFFLGEFGGIEHFMALTQQGVDHSG